MCGWYWYMTWGGSLQRRPSRRGKVMGAGVVHVQGGQERRGRERERQHASHDDALACRWLGTSLDRVALRLAEDELKDLV